ncbi:MAG: hypothetical protein JXK07_04660 [Spirochaetes bacterium]|nr:hypothetical protein [Spirochaetota bacterium]
MFIELAELGKAVVSEDEIYKFFIEDIGSNYTIGIAINFSDDGEKYLGCHTEEFVNQEKRIQILYRSGPSKGFDPTPVCRFSGKVENVFERMARYLKDLSEFSKSVRSVNLKNVWFENKREIQGELNKKVAEIVPSPKKGIFFYIRIGENPFWGYKESIDYFKDWISKAYAEKDGTPTVSENTLCNLCNLRKAMVYGNVSIISSYHLDQPGAIAGGFKHSQGVRNFPVCLECAGYLSKGFDYASSMLNFFMGGLRYLLIPSSSQVNILKSLIDMIEKRKSEVILDKTELGALAGKEDRLLRLIAYKYGDNDFLTIKIVFYIGEQKKWRILSEIQRVLPSRLKMVYEVKKECEDLAFLKKDNKPDHMSLGLIRFICNEDNSGNNKFLTYISAIFGGKKLSYDSVLKDIVKRLRQEYRRDSGMKDWLARHSLLLLYFLNKIDVITLPEGGIMEQKEFSLNEYLVFINEHKSFFSSPGKRVAFLTGALIAEVLYSGPESQPFRRHLGDYRFDNRKLMKLRALAENKIAAYDREKGTLGKTRELRQLLDICWSETEDKWPDKEDDLTLATIMGISLNGYIARKIISHKKGGNDDNN